MSFVPKLVNLAAAVAASASVIHVANAQDGALSTEQKERIMKGLLLDYSQSQNSADEGAINAYKGKSLDGSGQIFLNGHIATFYTKAPEVEPFLSEEALDDIDITAKMALFDFERKYSPLSEPAKTEEELSGAIKLNFPGMHLDLAPAVFHKGTKYTVDFNTARICAKDLESSEPQDCFAVKDLPDEELAAQIRSVKDVYKEQKQFKPVLAP